MATSSQIKAIRPVGEHGLLVEATDVDYVHRLTAWVRSQPCFRQLTEVIPAVQTLFLVGDRKALDWLGKTMRDVELPETQAAYARTVEVPVRYDGIDLHDVAERTGLTRAEVVKAHAGSEYRVDFFGFSPGQAFFSGVPDCLSLPRRLSPRTRVPTGSVAIANQFTVIYPVDSPGGWNLIGTRAGAALWDSRSEPPNKVNVGDRIVFKEVR